jgi:methionyl-tRNA formyltransferase
MSIVFWGTPAFAVASLKRIAKDGHSIAAVVTQPDRPAGRKRTQRESPIKTAAQELGLPVLQPSNLREERFIERLRRFSSEVMVVVAYGEILRENVLDIPARGVLNVHPSLLPRWRGASPIPAAILAGDDRTGVSIMLMDAGMDSGPLLAQREIGITDGDTTLSLSHTLAAEAADLLGQTLPRWLSGELSSMPQDNKLATYCPLLKKEDGAIDWGLPAIEISRRVRAYNPWPGAFTFLEGELVHIWRAWPLAGKLAGTPGTISELPGTLRDQLPEQLRNYADFAVETESGLLVPLEVQRAGRRSLSAAEFRRGLRGLAGRRLDSPSSA